MVETEHPSAAIIVPVGPGRESALDTLDSVVRYCQEPHIVVIVDDHTSDGTYEGIVGARYPNWHILRNARTLGVPGLVQTLCLGYRHVLEHTSCSLVLRLDQDALIIKPGVLTDALQYASDHPTVGLYGVYEQDYNRPRSFEVHRRLITQETRWWRRMVRRIPAWAPLLALAEHRGYRRGANVFGGAYFVTRNCLTAMDALGALAEQSTWNSRIMEDVYFSIAAVAAGFDLGHFAAPEGPLCMDWRKLPHPAEELARSRYKIIHSVDKGPNTGPYKDGRTARGVFRSLRKLEFEADR